MKRLWRVPICILVALMILAACAPAPAATPPPPTGPAPTQPPPATEAPTATTAPTTIPQPAEPVETIFTNGTVITLEDSQPLAEAVALGKGSILAVGPSDQIAALAGPDTAVIDLKGATLMPGFIDGHTHILRRAESLQVGQETAIRHGFTMISEMWADQAYLNKLMDADKKGSLDLRVNVFPSYNEGILDNWQTILLKTWWPGHEPILDPAAHLRIPGIKIFVDGTNGVPGRGCWALTDPYPSGADDVASGTCGTERGDLYLSQDELNAVVAAAQADGFRVAFHAMGDRGIETALNAIEFALNGEPNANHRHQIEHNSLARDDQVPRYVALDVPASIRGYGEFCDWSWQPAKFGPDRAYWYVNRYAIADTNPHAYLDTDFAWTVDPENRIAQRNVDPIMQLYGYVTHRFFPDPSSAGCVPPADVPIAYIPVERALRLLTIQTAYAVSMEDYVGSVKPGKYADLVILSGNPLTVAAEEIKDLRVWMTMIGGEAKYCDRAHLDLCAGTK